MVREAVKRLTDKEMFDRTFRLRRAVQLDMTHEGLSMAEQTPPEQVPPSDDSATHAPSCVKDRSYLWAHIEAVCKEREEKDKFDNMVPK